MTTPETLRATIRSLAWHPCPSCRRDKQSALAAADAWDDLERRFAEEVEWDNKRADKILAELEEKYDEVRDLRKRLAEAVALGKAQCYKHANGDDACMCEQWNALAHDKEG